MGPASPQPFMLRDAAPADSASLTALAREAKASWGYPEEWLRQWDAELTLSAGYVAAHRVIVADSPRGILGVCAIEERGTHWGLEHLWVSPRAQRLGVGSALVRDALRAVREGGRSKRVRVAADPNAVPFYAAMGAREVGSEPAPMPGAPARMLPIMEFDPAAGS
jgi:GNAT superfamily N-acetyltransferase